LPRARAHFTLSKVLSLQMGLLRLCVPEDQTLPLCVAAFAGSATFVTAVTLKN
jgi:hypothetical protein